MQFELGSLLPDRQQIPPRCLCSVCGGELYGGERVYDVDGEIFCEGCLIEYALRRFAPCRCHLEVPRRGMFT